MNQAVHWERQSLTYMTSKRDVGHPYPPPPSLKNSWL